MSYRILLVDDEPDILEFVGYNLSKAGYRVFTARDGREGVEAARLHRPHLILLDRMMPEMDGVETCRAIRRIPELDDTRIVSLSALGEEEHQIAGFDVGADDYLTKPTKMKIMLSRVQAILKRVTPDDNLTPHIDRDRHTVRMGVQELGLPRKSSPCWPYCSRLPAACSPARRSTRRSGGAKWSSATVRSTSISASSAPRSVPNISSR